jgi:hypothetical protein
MIQGVREIFEILDSPTETNSAEDVKDGKIVLIGRHVQGVDFSTSLSKIIDS